MNPPHPKTTQRGAHAPLWILPASPAVVLSISANYRGAKHELPLITITRHSEAKASCGNNLNVAAAQQTLDLFFEGVPVGEKYEEILGPRKIGDFKGCPLNTFCILLCGQKYAVGDKNG